MKHGFFKVAAATPIIKTADPSFNAENIIKMMEEAEKKGVKVLLFPELSLTGYTCNDLFFQSTLRKSTIDALDKIREKTKETGTVTVIGLPLEKNAKLYNTAVFLYKGEILGVVPKTYIPNYGEFYERRYFASAPAENGALSLFGASVPFGSKLLFAARAPEGLKIGVELCEDLWSAQPPSVFHAVNGATVIVNLSASDETVGKAEYRRNLISVQSARLAAGYVYADAGAGESTSDMVFAGHNVVAENGRILSESLPFSKKAAVSEIDVSFLLHERSKSANFGYEKDGGYLVVPYGAEAEETQLTRAYARFPFVPERESELGERAELILTMQAEGLKRRLAHIGAKTLVIGLSGTIIGLAFPIWIKL